MYVKSKGTEFNVEMFRNWTREMFMNRFAGTTKADLPKVWDEIQIELAKANGTDTESNKGAEDKSLEHENANVSAEGNEISVQSEGVSGLDNKSKHRRSALPKGDK